HLHARGIYHGHSIRSHLAGARGMKRGFRIPRHPGQNLLVRGNLRAGRNFASAELGESRLAEDLAGTMNRFYPFSSILGSREIVARYRRLFSGIPGPSLIAAVRIGNHLTHMLLIAVAALEL